MEYWTERRPSRNHRTWVCFRSVDWDSQLSQNWRQSSSGQRARPVLVKSSRLWESRPNFVRWIDCSFESEYGSGQCSFNGDTVVWASHSSPMFLMWRILVLKSYIFLKLWLVILFRWCGWDRWWGLILINILCVILAGLLSGWIVRVLCYASLIENSGQLLNILAVILLVWTYIL